MIINFDNKRPNPLVILAESMELVKNHGYDQIVTILMKGDADIVNWSEMKNSDFAYASMLLQKHVLEGL